jgi:glycosyltransferase involved in cell wall biosynthesis
MEHFGISTVEAMYYGVVPIVVKLGGSIEIITGKRCGYLWSNERECVDNTVKLIENHDLWLEYAKNAMLVALEYSVENFFMNLHEEFKEI